MADANAAALESLEPGVPTLSGAPLTLEDAVDAYVTDREERGEIGHGTARQLRWRLGLLVDACSPELEVAALGPEHIKEWQRSVGSQRASSRRVYLSTVRTFCRWCIDEELLAKDPTARVARVREPRAVPRALSDAQLGRLRAVLPGPEAKLIVVLMYRLGLRCVEVANLNIRDYDPVAATVLVTGKFANERLLPVPPDVGRLLDRHIFDRTMGPVFPGANAAKISRWVSRWMDRAGLKNGAKDGVSAHALRHTAASNLLEHCGDVRLVQAFLGHVSLVTTSRYLRRVDVEKMRAALAD